MIESPSVTTADVTGSSHIHPSQKIPGSIDFAVRSDSLRQSDFRWLDTKFDSQSMLRLPHGVVGKIAADGEIPNGGMCIATGSLTMVAPGGMAIEALPLNVSAWSELASIAIARSSAAHMNGPDQQWLGSEAIRKPNPRLLSAGAHVNNLSQCLPGKIRRMARTSGHHGRAPRRHPRRVVRRTCHVRCPAMIATTQGRNRRQNETCR